MLVLCGVEVRLKASPTYVNLAVRDAFALTFVIEIQIGFFCVQIRLSTFSLREKVVILRAGWKFGFVLCSERDTTFGW